VFFDSDLEVENGGQSPSYFTILPDWLKSFRLPVMGPKIADQVAKNN
jgi:hypothetical protein